MEANWQFRSNFDRRFIVDKRGEAIRRVGRKTLFTALSNEKPNCLLFAKVFIASSILSSFHNRSKINA